MVTELVLKRVTIYPLVLGPLSFSTFDSTGIFEMGNTTRPCKLQVSVGSFLMPCLVVAVPEWPQSSFLFHMAGLREREICSSSRSAQEH